MRRALILGAILLALIGAGWVWTGRPLVLPVAMPERDVAIRVFGLGTVEAQVLSRVGFEVPGTLTEVLADHGDRVRAGQVLARLNPAAQEARLARAEATVQNAEAHALRVAAQVERANVLMQQKRSVAARRRDLAARGTASVETAELAETEAAAAAADLAVATADLAVARASLAEARAGLLVERTALARHALAAPYDALVIARLREPGSALAAGEPVFTLVDPASIWVLAHVDESRAGRVAEGQTAEIRLRSQPGSVFTGHVARIGLESDRVTEERRVHVRCDQCPSPAVLGEQAQVEVLVDRLPAARLVPEIAVEGFDGATGRVWLIIDGVLQQREVRFVARTLDARLAVDPALPATWYPVIRVPAAVTAGRRARPE